MTAHSVGRQYDKFVLRKYLYRNWPVAISNYLGILLSIESFEDIVRTIKSRIALCTFTYNSTHLLLYEKTCIANILICKNKHQNVNAFKGISCSYRYMLACNRPTQNSKF